MGICLAKTAGVLTVAFFLGISVNGVLAQMGGGTPLPDEDALVRFSPDGTLLAGSSIYTIRLWSVESGEQVRTITPPARMHCVAISPLGKTIAAGCSDQSVYLWELETGELSGTISIGRGTVTHLAFSPDGKFLATASEDAAHNGRTIAALQLLDLSSSTVACNILQEESASVEGVSFSPNGACLAVALNFERTGGSNAEIRYWQTTTSRWQRTHAVPDTWISQICHSPDGTTLVCSGLSPQEIGAFGELYVLSAETGEQIWKISDHSNGSIRISLSPDGCFVLGASDLRIPLEPKSYRELKVWDSRTGRVIWREVLKSQAAHDIVFAPNGKTLAVCGVDGVFLRDATTGGVKRRFARTQ